MLPRSLPWAKYWQERPLLVQPRLQLAQVRNKRERMPMLQPSAPKVHYCSMQDRQTPCQLDVSSPSRSHYSHLLPFKEARQEKPSSLHQKTHLGKWGAQGRQRQSWETSALGTLRNISICTDITFDGSQVSSKVFLQPAAF